MTRWLIWGGFVVVWTTMLLLPGKDFNKAQLHELRPTLLLFVTKSAHILAYCLFAFLSGWLCVPARYRWMPLFFVMAHGAVTELIQYHYVSGRHGCLEDVVMNHTGVLLGVLIGWKWWTDPK